MHTPAPNPSLSPDPPPRRPAALIALHWGTALTVTCALVLVLGRELADAKEVRLNLVNAHRAFGLVVLFATLLRPTLRFRHPPQKQLASLPRALKLAAGATHLGLYGLLFALPTLGWALSSARGQRVSVPGLGPLPDLTLRNADLAETLADYHAWATWTLLAVHALAALWHHYFRRDPVLTAMLPAVFTRSPASPMGNRPPRLVFRNFDSPKA